jgi:hypothetical protein
MAQNLDPILKQFLDWSQKPKQARKGAKQRRLEPSLKAKSQEPDDGVPISQGAYESKIADLISYMRGGAVNDTTNSVRREAAQIAIIDRHKQTSVPRRIHNWTCKISKIGIELNNFSDRANNQEPIGFHVGNDYGLFCDAQITYLLVMNATRENYSLLGSFSIGQPVSFSGMGIGRRRLDMRTIVRADQVTPFSEHESDRSPPAQK